MAYSSRLRAGIGAVRGALASIGIERQGERFAAHGEHAPDADAPLVLVACSGGRDSMALAALCGIVCPTLGVRCGAIVIDHGIQAGSRQVAEEAAQRCRSLGLDPALVRSVEVRDDGHGMEAAARDARYRAICAEARRMHAAAVMLAHTRDDQAETMLLGLLRSPGVDALSGMPAVSVRGGVTLARPILTLSRDQTTGICRDLDIAWWDDPTNGDGESGPLDSRFPLRSRIRHDLVPMLSRFAGFDVTDRLTRAAALARLEKSYLDERADEALSRAVLSCSLQRLDDVTDRGRGDRENGDHGGEEGPRLVLEAVVRSQHGNPLASGLLRDGDVLALSVVTLSREHPAIRLRALARSLTAIGVEASAAQIAAVDALIVHWHGQGPVNLPSGYSAFRQKHVIRVCQDGGHANR